MDRFPIRSKVLIVTEGYTEKNYLERLRERDNGFELIVRRCPEQRPNKILRFCVSCMNDLGISPKDGDSAYCVFDVDYTSEERLQKVMAEAERKGIGIILSNRVSKCSSFFISQAISIGWRYPRMPRTN